MDSSAGLAAQSYSLESITKVRFLLPSPLLLLIKLSSDTVRPLSRTLERSLDSFFHIALEIFQRVTEKAGEHPVANCDNDAAHPVLSLIDD